MSYIGQQLPADVFSGFTTDAFTGNGSDTTFTLSKAPFSEDGLIVVINNVIQKPTTNFTVSGTTLTIVGTAVADGDSLYAIHTSGAVPSTLASKVDLNGVSDTLILDADGDTTISADTDDQIDIKIGGADDFAFKANNFEVQSGSTIDMNGQELILDADADTSITADTDDQIDFKVGGNDTHVFDANGHVTLKQFLDATTAGGRITGASNRGNVARVNLYQTAGSSDGGEIRLETANSSNTMTERMRIASTGNVGIGQTDTTPALGITVADTRVTSGVLLDVHHNKTDTTFSGIVARFQSARNTTNGTYEHIRCAISGVANKFIVTDGGTIQAVNTTVASVSDERIKQDIVDANSQWDDIKALKFKNFKKKQAVRDDGENALKELGVIAQDVESAGMSGLIEMTDPDISHIKSDSAFGTLWTDDDDEVKNGTETVGEVKEIKEKVKTVKYSMIWMKAVKALQEAQARIETLETKVKALEDA